jgi:hypothetical protein
MSNRPALCKVSRSAITYFLCESFRFEPDAREVAAFDSRAERSFAATVDAESPCLLRFCKTLKAFGLLMRPPPCFGSGVDGELADEASPTSVKRRLAAMALIALTGALRMV